MISYIHTKQGVHAEIYPPFSLKIFNQVKRINKYIHTLRVKNE